MEKVATRDDKVQVAKAHSSYKRTRSPGEGSIYKNSRGMWVARLSWTLPSGELIRKEQTFKLQRQAKEALTQLRRLRDTGQDPRTKAKTVDDLLTAWLDFKVKSKSIGNSTVAQYGYALDHLKQALGSIEVINLTSQDVDRALTIKLEEGLSPRYVKLLRSVLSMALTQGVRWKIVVSNAARDSSPIKQNQNTGRSLTQLQANTLLDTASQDRLCALWITLLSLGLRRGEALGLRWSDYNKSSRTLFISRNRKKEGSKVVTGDLKTAASRRVIPLPNFVLEALEAHRKAQLAEKEHLMSLGVAWAYPEAMFSTPTGHYLDPDNASKAFKRLAEKAGLGNWHLHELRHSAASFMLGQGVALEVVADILGHSSIRITKDTYGHLTTERLKVGADAMDLLFGGTSVI